MSSTVGAPRSVSNQLMPRQNFVKTLPYVAQTASGGPDALDISYLLSNNIIDQIQSVYIDNSEGTTQFVLTVGSSNMKVKVKAGTQGWYPLLVGMPAQGQFLFSGANALTPLFFCNFPMPSDTWDTGSEAASSTVQQIGGSTPWTSYSGTTANPAASTLLIPAGTAGKRTFVRITCGSDLWVNPIGGTASVNGGDCFKIPAGTLYENFPGESVYQEWNYYCATTGAGYTALAQEGL